MTSKNGINTYPETRATCLGCKADMPYRTTTETICGHSIEVPLRFCVGCHEKDAEYRSTTNSIKLQAKAFDMMMGSIFGSGDHK